MYLLLCETIFYDRDTIVDCSDLKFIKYIYGMTYSSISRFESKLCKYWNKNQSSDWRLKYIFSITDDSFKTRFSRDMMRLLKVGSRSSFVMRPDEANRVLWWDIIAESSFTMICKSSKFEKIACGATWKSCQWASRVINMQRAFVISLGIQKIP